MLGVWFICGVGLRYRVYVAAETKIPAPAGTPMGSNAKSLFVVTPPFIQLMRPWYCTVLSETWFELGG